MAKVKGIKTYLQRDNVQIEIDNHSLLVLDMGRFLDEIYIDEYFNFTKLNVKDEFGDVLDWYILPGGYRCNRNEYL